ncbi:hypothetical protein MTO96_043544 [Rhipicephalus appendiculatus]
MYYEREAEALYRQGRDDSRQRPEHRTRDGSGPEAFPKLQANEKGRSAPTTTRSKSRSRSRFRLRSRPTASNTGSPRAQGGGRSQSPKGPSGVNGTEGPLQVSWADAASGGALGGRGCSSK